MAADCVDVVSLVAAGVDVIACEDEGVLGSEAAGATDAEPAVDAVSADLLAELRSLRAEEATLLFERDALPLEAVTDSSFFTVLLDFAGSVGGDDSIGAASALGSVAARAGVVTEVLVALVSAALGVAAAMAGPRVGLAATTGCEATWWSNMKAPPIATATIAPNAIPKCLTRISLRDV